MSSKYVVGSLALLGTAAACATCTYYLYWRKNEGDEQKKRIDELLGVLDQEYCHLKDPAVLRGKIKELLLGGAKKLQVVTDFDMTLTKYNVDGKRGQATFGVVEESSLTPKELSDQVTELRDHYYPLEMSTTLSEAEKVPLMIEWYNKSLGLFLQIGMKKSSIPAIVQGSRCVLRPGADQFFNMTKDKGVPVLILSAGLGDIIEEVLRQQIEEPLPQVEVISNFFKYNTSGVVSGIQDTMIHSFNKNEVHTRNEGYFQKVKAHTNVIVMGDTLGDPAMAEVVVNSKAVIKIGFLNSNVEEALPTYLQYYDIVLTNDASLDLINVFMQTLLKDD